MGIRLSGRVQGVGFRPFVWRVAQQLQLTGSVANRGGDVLIEVEGAPPAIAEFIRILREQAPVAATVEDIHCQTLPYCVAEASRSFAILDSVDERGRVTVPDDRAICSDCLAELQDPENRRFGHLFIHCTQCGPRAAIIRSLPYDRSNSTMADFKPCMSCNADYQDGQNPRFHAQTNACNQCGPHYWISPQIDQSCPAAGLDLVHQVAYLLRQGHIVAIKSTGGFRLSCIANCQHSVALLRQRKRRPDKPLALMALDLAQLVPYVEVSAREGECLMSAANPIVLLKRKYPNDLAINVAINVAPEQARLGFMLPGNAFEYLLLKELQVPLVMTSGNVSAEFQWTDNAAAERGLAGIADYFVLHDRTITQRLDDSVVRADGLPMVYRRGRGLSHQTLYLSPDFAADTAVLAMGAELKNTLCLLRGNSAHLSSHIGDLKQGTVALQYRDIIDHYCDLYQFAPSAIAVDCHRDYISTRMGCALAEQWSIPLIAVQHHHAHIAAVMAEHRLPMASRVIGVAFDGMGMGVEGELWGGEFLLASYTGFQRFARLAPVALPGGNKAAEQPWRNLLAQLLNANLLPQVKQQFRDFKQFQVLLDYPGEILSQAVVRGLNSPLASSAGRLVDAVAAALGLAPPAISYEGQAAIILQDVAQTAFASVTDSYPVNYIVGEQMVEVDWRPFWPALLGDLAAGVSVAVMAAKFHRTLISSICAMVIRQSQSCSTRTVVLAGGVMQNTLLVEGIMQTLAQQDFTLLTAQTIPTNDAGIALGQGVIAAAQILTKAP